MIDVKRCTCCARMLCVSEFDFKQTNNGRKRRKEVCRSCLGKQKERRAARAAAVDPRDYKPDVERVLNEMVRLGRSAQQSDDALRDA